MVKLKFVQSNGTEIETDAALGMSVMQAAVNAGVNEIAAECGGACACGTCHCVLPQEWFDRVAAPQDDEIDMLEFVIEPQPTSRLSCQIVVSEDLQGMEINVPDSQV
ncbi:2Fe-2S iron-sulfur cluster-binding protein [Shimia sagamensis]|uniref:Ferredoxin, 2Fe-2S n=1 Tax=Shimia sagamensis TaxID=1566352 RepID=A0ABY1PFZ7_9RHOB|nr:2Fe-2S iron-sulfur cluster-binding protein [Shimia sagamensis]SMP33556.1 ferredoxin, 2Fe-2S [Shimia sagamensis]